MVDRSDLERVGRLFQEAEVIDAALGNLDAGGDIVAMTISAAPPNQPPPMGPVFQTRMAVTVSTVMIEHPPQMLDSIRQQFMQRLAAINGELTQLGVTGTEAMAAAATAQQRPQHAPPQAQPAQPAPRR